MPRQNHALERADHMDETRGSAGSSAPNSAKRLLFGEDNTSSKRPRLLESHTGQVATFEADPPVQPAPLSPPPRTQHFHANLPTAQPQSMANLSRRVDHALVLHAAERFRTVVKLPILSAYEVLQGRCTACLLLRRDDWDTHEIDNCSGPEMHYRYDQQFVEFRNKMKFHTGFCYGCGLRQVHCFLPYFLQYVLIFHFQKDFDHTEGDSAKDCPGAGHMIWVLYVFSWGNYPIFQSYPGRPTAKCEHSTEPTNAAVIMYEVP